MAVTILSLSLALAGPLTGRDSSAGETAFDSAGSLSYVDGVSNSPGGTQPMPGLVQPTPCAFAEFYVDYRIRRLNSSHTSYELGWSDVLPVEFGTPTSPLSRLEFPINSTWNGLEFGLENPCWAVRGEWLVPVSNRIDGRVEERDWLWQNAGFPPSTAFSNFGVADQRWVDGQMVDVSAEIKLWEGLLGVPISVWPVGGFRWQKFDIMGFDLQKLMDFDSALGGFVWLPEAFTTEGDAIRFRQEYYHYYGGGQIRTELGGDLLPLVRLTFQGDWAHVQGYNYDNHLLLAGNRIRKQITEGHALHFGVTAEMFLLTCLTLGIEGEYTQIRTFGSHQDINVPLGIDQTRQNDARVWSDQTAITLFLRFRH